METTTETVVYERVLQIDASPETVWEFLVDPEKLMRWKGVDAKLDPRPGGIFWCEIIPGHVAAGEYVELDPPHRVVFTWGWEGQESSDPHGVPPGSSRVEVTLEPDGAGTLVRLRHLDLPEESREIHGEGWDLYLGRLAIAASGGEAGPDPAGVQTDKEE